MANPHTFASPNQAVYEENSPYVNGPLGLQNGPARAQGQQIIAIHENSDGSYSGIGEDGTVVHLS